MTTDQHWTLMIHGGSGVLTRDTVAQEVDEAARKALGRALDAGAAILTGGGSAVDAVEAAVQVLEEDPVFNAGRGAALALDGSAELDAAIMDGHTRAAGSVAGVRSTRSPVRLARAVMDDGRHVFLAGDGADQFARERGIEAADPAWFVTDARRAQLAELIAHDGDAFDSDMKYGTVGAVARDVQGHVAAATSTGGVTGKRWGRIGDSPVIGAGTYADDRAAAVSATGAGEYFLRLAVAHEICARVRLGGESIGAAATAAIEDVRATGGTGGVIVVGPAGDAAWHFSTPGMYRAKITSQGAREVAIYGDDGDA
jgi:beta-aspartyl-peptidase (threonine type)